MKPKDYRRPYTWGEQFVTIDDRILHTFEVRGRETPFSFPGWEDPLVFGNQNPVKVEFCSGNGDWIAGRAEKDPRVNWVAVEMLFDRVRRIWAKGKNRQLSNLFTVAGEALGATRRFFPPQSVEEVYINFPDPWPKKKHAKYRLICPEFLDELARILKRGGTVTFVTDDRPYSQLAIDTFLSHPDFFSLFEAPHYRLDWEGYGSSYFEELWRRKGLEIRYHLFGKREGSCN